MIVIIFAAKLFSSFQRPVCDSEEMHTQGDRGGICCQVLLQVAFVTIIIQCHNHHDCLPKSWYHHHHFSTIRVRGGFDCTTEVLHEIALLSICAGWLISISLFSIFYSLHPLNMFAGWINKSFPYDNHDHGGQNDHFLVRTSFIYFHFRLKQDRPPDHLHLNIFTWPFPYKHFYLKIFTWTFPYEHFHLNIFTWIFSDSNKIVHLKDVFQNQHEIVLVLEYAPGTKCAWICICICIWICICICICICAP